ncbi:hypothetical protein GCM10027170_14320 [Aliiglaciecola aliphaticivorans]
MMDKAQEMHNELEIEVFKKNVIGRKFYSQYGFVHLEEKWLEPTKQAVLRLKFNTNNLI